VLAARKSAERAEADARSRAVAAQDFDANSRWHTQAYTLVNIAAAAPKIKTAFLGVGVDTPSETVRSQLGLQPGAGLVVNYVEESGPSAKLVQMHDVLQKLDDQILVNGEQLVTLIRMHKAGDSVSLTLIRQAKPITVQVKLTEKEVPVRQSNAAGTTMDFETEYLPVDVQWTNLAAGPLQVKSAAIDPAGNVMSLRGVHAGPLRVDDGKMTIILPQGGDQQEMQVVDSATGKLMYRGPLITAEQDPAVQQLPPDVRSKIVGWQKALSQHSQKARVITSTTRPAAANPVDMKE